MDSQQIYLIRKSWAQLSPTAETVATLFYNKLFELDPALRPLFKHDIKAQGQKLMTVLGVAVGSLDKLEKILPALRDLGRRHADYGVSDAHYQTVGVALLWALQQQLGTGFTPELKQAWGLAYLTLAGVMREAAVQQAA